MLLQGFIREVLGQHPIEHQRSITAHGQYLLAFAEQAATGIRIFNEEKRWVERLDRDIDNIRTALDAWMAGGRNDLALECIKELRNFWVRTGRMREARRWLRSILEGQALDVRQRRQALALDGEMATDLHEYDVAQQQLEASLALAEISHLPAPLQRLHLGLVTQRRGDLTAARKHFERALAEFRGLGSLDGVAAALNNLGVLLTEAGSYADALDTFEQALQAKRKIGGDVESVLTYLGTLYMRMNRLDESGSHFAQALRGLVDRGFYIHIPEVLEGLGFVACAQGKDREASVLLGATERQREMQDVWMSPEEHARFGPRLAPLSEHLGAATFLEAWNEGRAMTREQAVAFALRA